MCSNSSHRKATQKITRTFFFLRFYLFIHETHTHTEKERERERERLREGEAEAGSMQGARCGTQSHVSRITPWAEGGA